MNGVVISSWTGTIVAIDEAVLFIVGNKHLREKSGLELTIRVQVRIISAEATRRQRQR